MSHSTDILTLLHDLETTLFSLSLWAKGSPDEKYTFSKMPFAMDVLEPHQWLQWVFIPKMRDALMPPVSETLYRGFEMTPYFEECWKDEIAMIPIIDILKQIDRECQ